MRRTDIERLEALADEVLADQEPIVEHVFDPVTGSTVMLIRSRDPKDGSPLVIVEDSSV